MPIKRRDTEFPLDKISPLDFKHIEMDRVLTNFFPKLKYDGGASRRKRKSDLVLSDFVDTLRQHNRPIVEAAQAIVDDPVRSQQYLTPGKVAEWFPQLQSAEHKLVQELLQNYERERNSDKKAQLLTVWFEGLSPERQGVLEKWVETELMDVVNRGKANQTIAAPRPLHGNTYRFRNAKHTRDYKASDQLYASFYFARHGLGQRVRQQLKEFFFPAVDLMTDRYLDVTVDVETQALLRLDQLLGDDTRDPSYNPVYHAPLCRAHADLLAEDTLRLLHYRDYIPRTVLVEYLKVLFGFHMGLYLLKLLKLLPLLVAAQGRGASCLEGDCPAIKDATLPHMNCAARIALVVDMGDPTNGTMRQLAERSAEAHLRRMPAFIQAYYVCKKLDEMAVDWQKTGHLPRGTREGLTLHETLALLQSQYEQKRESYFHHRMLSLTEDMSLDEPALRKTQELNLNEFDSFIEIIVNLRGHFYRRYLRECIDTLLLKNTAGGLLRQNSARGMRYFTMGSTLLEVLLQIAVLRSGAGGKGYMTQEIRVDTLLNTFRERYGLYIDRLPSGDGFEGASILDRQALRQNLVTFKTRLREIGFFRDLSDAYNTQTITSRYQIGE